MAHIVACRRSSFDNLLLTLVRVVSVTAAKSFGISQPLRRLNRPAGCGVHLYCAREYNQPLTREA